MGRVLVAVTSDWHTNSTIGLCPGSGIELDDGGWYSPSKSQRWLWRCWVDYWQRVTQAAQEYRVDSVVSVVNGDLSDYDHHDSYQIITRNPTTMMRIATSVAQPMFDVADRIFVVRGTRAHAGGSSYLEEKLAEDWNAIPDDLSGTHSWWHLKAIFGGVFFDIAHHGRTGGLPWTRPNPLHQIAVRVLYNYVSRGSRPPNVVVRSHRHLFGESGRNHPVLVISSPAWQLATEYSRRIAPEDVELANIGGLIFVCQDSKVLTWDWIGRDEYVPELREPWQEA